MRRTDFPLPSSWDRAGLEAIGFTGFVPLVGMDRKVITKEKGVYVLLRPDSDAPYRILEQSPLVAYGVEELERRWVRSAHVVYIGKAGGNEGLRERLSPFSRKARNHSGGRSIWQLHDADELLVCWAATPGLDPREVEKDYLDAFAKAHGAYPFANVEGRKRQSGSPRRIQ